MPESTSLSPVPSKMTDLDKKVDTIQPSIKRDDSQRTSESVIKQESNKPIQKVDPSKVDVVDVVGFNKHQDSAQI